MLFATTKERSWSITLDLGQIERVDSFVGVILITFVCCSSFLRCKSHIPNGGCLFSLISSPL